MWDEISRSAIGKRWLQYLHPEESDVAEVVETTNLLRNVLILSAFAQWGSGGLKDLIFRFSGGELAPNVRSDWPLSRSHTRRY